jgi:hypothetical protein
MARRASEIVKRKAGRPRLGESVRQVYGIRLAPEMVEEVRQHTDSLTAAIEEGLRLWLSQQSKRKARTV